MTFIDYLARNLAFVLTAAAVIGVGAGGVLFWQARTRRVAALRAKVRGEVPLTNPVLETLKRAFTPQVVEASAIGAVTAVDLAWHYALTDPAMWDDLPANLDVLGSTLSPEGVLDGLRSMEAAQVFGDMLGSSGAVVVEAKSESVVDALMDGAASADALADGGGSLALHIPVVTIGFASYRAWRRSQTGTVLGRNLEFAAIEVVTRAGGGLAGAQVGGTLGTVIVPGVGTVIGTVAGAVAGTLGGAALGETVKRRRVERATADLDAALTDLGRTYLTDEQRFRQLADVFREQEASYLDSLKATRQRLRSYATPWRVIWPDEKLILLEETVALAESRLGEVRQGTVDALDRLRYLRAAEQHQRLGAMLWANPALCQQLDCPTEHIRTIHERLQHEQVQLA